MHISILVQRWDTQRCWESERFPGECNGCIKKFCQKLWPVQAGHCCLDSNSFYRILWIWFSWSQFLVWNQSFIIKFLPLKSNGKQENYVLGYVESLSFFIPFRWKQIMKLENYKWRLIKSPKCKLTQTDKKKLLREKPNYFSFKMGQIKYTIQRINSCYRIQDSWESWD